MLRYYSIEYWNMIKASRFRILKNLMVLITNSERRKLTKLFKEQRVFQSLGTLNKTLLMFSVTT